jgi:hypothetical protein
MNGDIMIILDCTQKRRLQHTRIAQKSISKKLMLSWQLL